MPAHIARARTRRADAMATTCVITREGTGTLDAETNEISASTVTVYSGPCSLVPELGGTKSQAGEQQRDMNRYLVRLPGDTTADVAVGDLVAVDGEDSELADLQLEVDQVVARSTSVFRTLRCVDTARVRSGP